MVGLKFFASGNEFVALGSLYKTMPCYICWFINRIAANICVQMYTFSYKVFIFPPADRCPLPCLRCCLTEGFHLEIAAAFQRRVFTCKSLLFSTAAVVGRVPTADSHLQIAVRGPHFVGRVTYLQIAVRGPHFVGREVGCGVVAPVWSAGAGWGHSWGGIIIINPVRQIFQTLGHLLPLLARYLEYNNSCLD